MKDRSSKRRKLRRYLEKNYTCFVTFTKTPEKGQTTAYYKRLRGPTMTKALKAIMEIFNAED